ncbi:hypothetical protein [Lactobacillus agrestimuris]|uniref:hypothetical protein n=1 Tax=Lactobacillus agrestimuris TaxID=2941328 RepID=UPI0019C7BB08|nr:hypothetical protein [Lactobacillus agrestimuris]MBD5430860.1 hypothetical protein [Lactobacillus sp.]
MADYEKRQLKALDRIAKKIADADSHLTKIEDSIDDKKHHTAQHETIKDIKSILKHARKVDKYEDKIVEHNDEGHKGSEAHYVYIEDEEPVINDLKKEFDGLEEKLNGLTDEDGYKVKAFEAEHDYLEKAKEILTKAGKF